MGRLLSEAWSKEHFASEGFFTRGGPLTPELLVALVLYMCGDAGRRGYAQLLDEFWAQARLAGVSLPVAEPVSSAAFCLARRKLMPSLFDALLQLVREEFDTRHSELQRWRGRRVLAVDGTRRNLTRSEELFAHFGQPSGGHVPQALVSTLFDVVAKVPIATQIAPCASDERAELLGLLPHLAPGDVLVLDRGYPSYEVIERLVAAGIDFVIRVPKSHTFPAIDVFQQSGGNDYRVVLGGPGTGRVARQLESRLVRISNGRKEPWIILTSLRRDEFSRTAIGQIYHMRWEVEELFKLEKSDYFSLRQLHAKTVRGVQQELRAQLLFTALARLILAEATAQHDVSYSESSQKSAMLTLAGNLVVLFLADDPDVAAAALDAAYRRAIRIRHRKRLGRSCPRRSFKPGPRWNSQGRVGA